MKEMEAITSLFHWVTGVAKGAKASKPTSTLKTSRGFSLLEVMVVVAIIAAVVAVAIQRVGNRDLDMKATARRLSVLSKQIHSLAKLQNATFRIAIKMENPDQGDAVNQYWVEKTTQKVIFTGKSKSLEEVQDEEDEREEGDNSPVTGGNGFAIHQPTTKEPIDLPDGLIFSKVELGTNDEAVDSGVAYIHFLPEGLVEEAAIHLSFGDKLKWTVAIHPLTGRADVIGKEVSLEDIREQ